MSAKATYQRPVTPKWSDSDMRIWRSGEARKMVRAAGLSPEAGPPIIRNASDKAQDNHDLFFEHVQQQIDDFDKPLPTFDVDEFAKELDGLPQAVLQILLNLVTDWNEMWDEGYSDEEILLYIKRTYLGNE